MSIRQLNWTGGTMTRDEALAVLATLEDESFQDDGTWKFGHDFSLLTSEGYFTMSNDVYEPILGPEGMEESRLAWLRARYPDFDEPVEVDEATQAELKARFPDYEEPEIDLEDQPLFEDLELMERLIVKRDGKPGVDYYAFASYEGEDLDQLLFTDDYAEIEEAMNDTITEFGSFTPWEEVEDEELIALAQEVLDHRAKKGPNSE